MQALVPLCSSPPCGAIPCLRPLRTALPSLRLSSGSRHVPLLGRVSNSCPLDLNWEGEEVDVIGIGSRKDAIIDFCLASSSSSASGLRFWTIQSRDSSKVQLLHRSCRKDLDAVTVDCPLPLRSCCPGIILVASAGHVPDDAIALELLNGVKSAGGLAVTILLKPFCFEGQRRQQEVDNFMRNLQHNSQLFVAVETDALLKTKEETLSEAIKIVNHAVLLTVDLISLLIKNKQIKFLDAPNEQVKELQFAELLKLLGNYGESKVCYGAAYDVKSSIMQAILKFSCSPSDLKGSNGIVVLSVTGAMVMDGHDLSRAVQVFRQITNCNKKIIFFSVHQTSIEVGLVITTLLVFGFQKVTPKRGFLSGLFQAFPPLLSFLWRNSEMAKDTSYSVESSLNSNANNSYCNVPGSYSEFIGTQYNRIYGSEKMDKESSPLADNKSHSDEDTDLMDEKFDKWTLGPAFHIAQKWAKERSSFSETTLKLEGVDSLALPVGVRFSGNCYDDSNFLEPADSETLGGAGGKSLGSFSLPAKESDTSLEDLISLGNVGFSVSRGKDTLSRKPGALSVRVASMLESERVSEKKWAPFVQMEYRGGLYGGRCQGGLPEGKGWIIFKDGSFYDGIWQNGKRSGSGRYCYSNGDMYQGMWRDDFMHGKGWFYFHTGDRWFVNFWKGKANGEGRFYSKSGSVFFGHFQNGWRHGESLFIDADGSRWFELWEEGVLIRRNTID